MAVCRVQEKVTKFNDQLLRSLAEQENVRMIAKRDVDNARQFGVQKFALVTGTHGMQTRR